MAALLFRQQQTILVTPENGFVALLVRLVTFKSNPPD
jgi:hypothetical protein